MALHRAWQTAAERLYREFQWPSARRVAERDAVQLARPCPSGPAEWRLDYNTIRPHSSLGILPPAHHAKLSAPASQRDGSLRAIGGSAPRPVAAPSRAGSDDQPTLLISGWQKGLRSLGPIFYCLP